MTWQLTARWNPWKSRLRHSVSNRGFSKFEVYSVSHSHCHSHPHPHTRTLSNQSTLSATHSHRLLPCAFAPPVVDSSATPGALTLTATHTHTHTLSLSNQSTLSATHSHRHSQRQTKPEHSKPRTLEQMAVRWGHGKSARWSSLVSENQKKKGESLWKFVYLFIFFWFLFWMAGFNFGVEKI